MTFNIAGEPVGRLLPAQPGIHEDRGGGTGRKVASGAIEVAGDLVGDVLDPLHAGVLQRLPDLPSVLVDDVSVGARGVEPAQHLAFECGSASPEFFGTTC